MYLQKFIIPGVVLILTVALNGCALFSKEVKMEDVPTVAQTVIQTHVAGGIVEKIKCEKDGDKHLYKVDYTKDGREFELKVDEDGKVLEIEEAMKMEELPPAVQATVKTETTGADIKELVLETEEGKTFYEVEFEKDGKEHEVKIAEDGTVLEREVE